MRRSYLAMTLLLSATVIVLAGCRQPAGSMATGAIAPLSPSNPAAPPSFLPFGGATRVTPPPTGSYGAPATYLGGAAPIGQTSIGPAWSGDLTAAANGPVLGSGVARAGWSETNANTPMASPNANVSTFGANPSPAPDPRRGGMQVIDLTGAASPPGYRPSMATQPVYNVQPSFNASPGYPPQQNFNPPQNLGRVQSIQAPTAREYASAIAPRPPAVIAQAPISPVPTVGNLTPINSGLPSTAPIGSGTPAQSNLPWRSPGARY